MICPLCQSNLEGGLIYQTFLEEYDDHDKALDTAGHYGATQTEGRWGREIGIYSIETDRTVAYQCPDCYGEWPR